MPELLELLKGLPVGGISFAGLVALAIVLIFRGDIVPKATVERNQKLLELVVESKDKEIALLKEAYTTSEQARLLSMASDKELLELGRTTVQLLRGIHQKANEAIS